MGFKGAVTFLMVAVLLGGQCMLCIIVVFIDCNLLSFDTKLKILVDNSCISTGSMFGVIRS